MIRLKQKKPIKHPKTEDPKTNSPDIDNPNKKTPMRPIKVRCHTKGSNAMKRTLVGVCVGIKNTEDNGRVVIERRKKVNTKKQIKEKIKA